MVPVDPESQAVQYFQYLPQFPSHLVDQVVPELRTVLSVLADQLAPVDLGFQDFPENQRDLVILDFQAYQAVHLLPENLSLQQVQQDLAVLDFLVLLVLLDFPEDQHFLDFRWLLPHRWLLKVLAAQGFQLIPVFQEVQLAQPVLERLENHYCLQHHLVQVHLVDLQVPGIQHYLEVRCHQLLQLFPAVLVCLDFQEFR